MSSSVPAIPLSNKSKSTNQQLHVNVSENVVKLKLKKPKTWNWELSTSKSSPNIQFPRIMLYDHKNKLLADAKQSDCIINGIAQTGNNNENDENQLIDNESNYKVNSLVNHRRCHSDTINNTSYLDENRSVDDDFLKGGGKKRSKSSSNNRNRRSRSANFDEIFNGLDDFKNQLNQNGINCTLTRHRSTDKKSDQLKRYDSGNIVTRNGSNENLNQTETRIKVHRRKSHSDLHSYVSSKHLSQQSIPEIPLDGQLEDEDVDQQQNHKEDTSLRPTKPIYRRSITCNLGDITRHQHQQVNGSTTIDISSEDNNIILPENKRNIAMIDEMPKLGLQKSRSALEVPRSSSCGRTSQGNSTKDKKRYRRTHSANSLRFSTSILERISEFKSRSSSTDSLDNDDEPNVDDDSGPKYTLRTSQAGTLWICEEIYRNRKVRRRRGQRKKSGSQDGDVPDEVIPLMGREKIINRYEFIGTSAVDDNSDKNSVKYIDGFNTEIIDPNERVYGTPIDDKFEIVTPENIYNSADKYASRYEKAIANIDDLISKVIRSHSKPDGGLLDDGVGNCLKRKLKFDESKTNGTMLDDVESHDDINVKILSKFNEYSGDKQCNRYLENENLIIPDQCNQLNSDSKTNHYFSDDDKVNYVSIEKNSHHIRRRSRHRSNNYVNHKNKSLRLANLDADNRNPIPIYHLNEPLNNKNTNSKINIDVVVDKKLKKKRRKRRMRRSASAGTDRSIYISSSASDTSDDDGVDNGVRNHQNINNNGNIIVGDENMDSHLIPIPKDKKNARHNHSIETNRRIKGEYWTDDGGNDNADQIVAVKNNISLSHLESTPNELINASNGSDNNNSDEVLIQLVHRLASLQQQQIDQQQQYDDEHSKYCDDNLSYNGSLINGIDENLNFLSNIIGTATEQNDESRDRFDCIKNDYIAKCNEINNMGSNVSRHSGKGLSGRRTQSSGDLCDAKQQTPNGSYNTPNNKRKSDNGKTRSHNKADQQTHHYQQESISENVGNIPESCPVNILAPLCVSKKDRNKFCGSLPNHLDDVDDVDRAENLSYSNYGDNNNTVNEGTLEYVTIGPQKLNQHEQMNVQQQHPNHYHPQYHPQMESSPYNNSSSEKESTSSSTNLGSTFKSNHDNKPDIQLKLPINRSNFDTGCDQGYGSERSPEDEVPPPLPLLPPIPYQPGPQEPQWDYDKLNGYQYSFITSDCCFLVQITKGPRGLGLSVSGGIDSNAAFPGLIRIKRLFPNQAAWCTGMLQPGDILLEANGIILTGLTNYEALEVLRTTPNFVTLTVCRPRDEQYRKLSPPTEPPKPPQRAHPLNIQLEPLLSIQTNFSGEFEIIMVKQQGSLGFTLRKEDESVLGHYVRALVREPATTDGRIKPGDKIVAVNDVPLCPMTHEQAVIFLRQAADTVKLRLYRDEAQTPIASMSPSNCENKTICSHLKQKACLRPEAINLLSDIAYRNKKQNTPGPESTGSSIRSNTNTSPRRLKRGQKNSSGGNTSHSETDKTDSKSFNYPPYVVTSQPTSICSDSETSTASQCSYMAQPPKKLTSASETDTDMVKSIESEFYGEDELWQMVEEECGADKINRPSFLDLAGNSGNTPIVSRKPRFQFSVAAHSYELNNLDNEALDAPIYTIPGGNNNMPPHMIGSSGQDFASLPCETILVACKTENDMYHSSSADSFKHKNPKYQSAHIQSGTNNGLSIGAVNSHETVPSTSKTDDGKKGGTKSLLKWKGVMFSPDEEKETSDADSSCAATIGTNPTPATDKDIDFNGLVTDLDGHKVLTVELNRGWNSRLGFSLKPHPNYANQTIISAIYGDSVAAKDGRLKEGDQLLMVNDISVEQSNMTTTEIIDLVRKIRGAISVTVRRNCVQ